MKFIKKFSFIPIIVLLFTICSCANGGQKLKIDISPSDKSLIDLASRIYDEHQLLELVKSNGSINEVNAKYPIECFRENHGTYRASYLGDGSIAVILFDDFGKMLFGKIYYTQRTKADFNGLAKGQMLEEVKKIDPDGEYLFLFSGRNDTPKVSSHYTKDGYLITIEYDEKNTIINIKVDLI